MTSDDLEAAVKEARSVLAGGHKRGLLTSEFYQMVIDEFVNGRSLMAAVLIEDGEPLPSILRQHVIKVLKREDPANLLESFNVTPHKRGPNPAALAYRNDVIAFAVGKLAMRGVAETRNAATTEHESACSIVSKELAKLGVFLSEVHIADIWIRWQRDALT